MKLRKRRIHWNFRMTLIDRLWAWARKWGMRFQPVKCNMMQLTRKRTKKINGEYTFEGTILQNVDKIKYLGVTITEDLRWNTHVSNIWTKVNWTLGFLRQNFYPYLQDVKEAAYKGLVRPVLEYCSFCLGSTMCCSPGGIRKCEKARSQICNRELQLWNWENDSHSWTIKMGISQEKEKIQ